jgi:uncharacterized membrane protein (Fun14 family)
VTISVVVIGFYALGLSVTILSAFPQVVSFRVSVIIGALVGLIVVYKLRKTKDIVYIIGSPIGFSLFFVSQILNESLHVDAIEAYFDSLGPAGVRFEFFSDRIIILGGLIYT